MLLTSADVAAMAEKVLSRSGLSVGHADGVALLDVTTDGNFTVVVIDRDGAVFSGVSKRNPKDPPDIRRGERLAAIRALERAFSLR